MMLTASDTMVDILDDVVFARLKQIEREEDLRRFRKAQAMVEEQAMKDKEAWAAKEPPETKSEGTKKPPPEKPPVAAQAPDGPKEEDESDDCRTCPFSDLCYPPEYAEPKEESPKQPGPKPMVKVGTCPWCGVPILASNDCVKVGDPSPTIMYNCLCRLYAMGRGAPETTAAHPGYWPPTFISRIDWPSDVPIVTCTSGSWTKS